MADFQDLIRSCNGLISQIKVKHSPRNATAVALMDLCYEHSASIDILCQQKRYGAAAALFRPCVEAYIRGAWVLYCATDSQVDETINGTKKGKPLSSLVAELSQYEATYEFLNQYAKTRLKNTLDSLSHGTSVQILNRFDGKSVRFIADDDVVRTLLREACFFALLSHSAIAEIAQDQSLEAKVLCLFDDMMKCV
ncbi:hypothetical protein EDB69_1043 [Vibrio crassostreae]|uniref:DUF6988 family protein n=1 Tax=Vibrio crassostreae TaxID=246167 RepID=UPI000FA8B2A2|nr:hypothetical protein [Vibrio crassostreae]ROO75672.1 hypothetical protein EDB64_0651 [Vibrio crassostreae]ROP13679.1 hypothetical protein EDB63_0675 [Vibrio crassostreae]RPE95082.1 hypothetical protein EDB68_1120 [Vibrio crassostreae]RPF17821.1 hypothetical protein EDB69_1043 [Vibrio crassostreae]